MTIDNSALIATFMPEADDGDQFLYTELLDRSKRAGGSNRRRVLRMFRHASREEFWRQWTQIRQLCELNNCRAYTRLAPRSHTTVGKLLTKLTVEAAMEERWSGMSYLYARACGLSKPVKKLWLLDVDKVDEGALALQSRLEANGQLVATVPSRQGFHLIVTPHDMREIGLPVGVALHRDNPTNLLIPDGAE
jgi:hypothetical protein